ncbi:Leucine-rich repeat (LRR) protein [Hahella chejuensis KCTC 2396]|uniref:Leucine-rich repeat (LRR) protein n=1 Tax=Hahella chejuensis (strain KCTC 2396) TaxID=349521 RepID=Q2SHG9_HAHCH|nr:leucine-rich repeat domain-containing protein [Hahella chejuensis]ABC29905.1 Leucine-rich repeat (LRR) protein [Hahella chejuensis KCTC 2396]
MLQRTLALMIFTLLAGCGQSEPQKAEPEANNAPQYSEAEIQRYVDQCDKHDGKSPLEIVRACVKLIKATHYHTLDLKGLNIDSLPDDVFKGLEHVKILYLSENSLSSLPKSISEMKSLKVVHLGWNEFKEFPVELFDIEGLKDVYISKNKISHIDEGLKNINSLRRIILSHNELKEFPHVFTEMPKLKILDLGTNAISEIPESIRNMSGLIGLSLSYNDVKAIPAGIGGLENLTMLDLSSNDLRSLPIEIAHLPKLIEPVENHSGFVNNLLGLGFEEDGEEIYGVSILKGYKTTPSVSEYSGINLLFNDISSLDREFCKVFFMKLDSKVVINCN